MMRLIMKIEMMLADAHVRAVEQKADEALSRRGPLPRYCRLYFYGA